MTYAITALAILGKIIMWASIAVAAIVIGVAITGAIITYLEKRK